MKYQFIQKYQDEFCLSQLCKILSVSRSGYYKWLKRKPGKREIENMKLLKEIKKIHKQTDQTYGSPRMTRELRYRSYSCSRTRVARIMAKNNIYAKTKRKFKPTTDSNHKHPVSPNLLNQDFQADRFNQTWVSDITYIRTSAGWVYLTVIIDLFNRQVVGWSMSRRLTAETTTIPALIDARQRQQPPEGLIFHSDRGVQYAAQDFRKKLSKFKMVQSMSGKGNCYDNAVAESFFKTLKTELVYFNKYKTREQARLSIFKYIEIFYNRQRMHSALGYKSPVEFLELKKVA
jgi:transposase InsO family protein